MSESPTKKSKMATSLDQLKEMTVVVADTGDFEGKEEEWMLGSDATCWGTGVLAWLITCLYFDTRFQHSRVSPLMQGKMEAFFRLCSYLCRLKVEDSLGTVVNVSLVCNNGVQKVGSS